jgi:hypothetical protein
VASFGGIPSTDGFTKRYELHFQPKKVVVNRAEVRAQYGCINFHTKHYGAHGAKLTVDIKKKWAGGWTREWFLCKVPLLRSPGPMRGKVIYALCSSMFALDFSMDPSFECAGNDAEDVVFVCATSFIGGRDVVEEYLACGLFLLSLRFGFGEIEDGETPMSKITLPLPEFPTARLPGETTDRFLVRVELVAENVVGSYIRGEHEVCILVLPNGGRLNWVFEQASVAYGPIWSLALRPVRKL